MNWSPVNSNRGFTYTFLLAVLAITSIMAGVTASVTSTYAQRDLEQELIFRGLQYRRAIESYYLAGTPRVFPRSLDDLIKDPRFVHRVHLRKHYKDPFDYQNKGWLLLTNTYGDIVGVASRSDKKSLKMASFPKEVVVLDSETSYRGWQFIYVPETLLNPSFPLNNH